MINLEQVKLLEARVAKAVDYVERLTKENIALVHKEAELQSKLDTHQGRIDELEVLLMRFREDQSQIEESILAALDRLSQFEKEMEKSLKEESSGSHAAAAKAPPKEAVKQPRPARQIESAAADQPGSDDGRTCFEIPEVESEDDISDPLEAVVIITEKPLTDAGSSPAENEELDIF